MNRITKFTAALTAAAGFALAAPSAMATVSTYETVFNGPAVCQAFTPGPTNTIRNRVLGAENVGTAAISVACDVMQRFGVGTTPITGLDVWFSNNNASGTVAVTCTLLTGYQTGSNIAVSKTVNVTVGAQAKMAWVATDFGTSATTFPNYFAGVNCTVPPGIVINDLHVFQPEDTGVGN